MQQSRRNSKRQNPLGGGSVVATASVALVLLLLGIVVLTMVAAHNVTRQVRSSIGVVALVSDTADSLAVDTLAHELATAAYADTVIYTDAEAVMAGWLEQMDAGDVSELQLDVNPFLAEYEVRVSPEWAEVDSLKVIAELLGGFSAVYEVKVHTDLAADVNRTIGSVLLVLLIVAAVLMVIAVVLINNTVRLTVYSQRRLIHTMQYVGATRGFIMRPYIVRGVVIGSVAGAVASLALAGLMLYVRALNPDVVSAIGWGNAIGVFLLMTVAGALICAVASWAATARYVMRGDDAEIHGC